MTSLPAHPESEPWADALQGSDSSTTVSPVAEILRDIARGGLAGLLVGIVVAGLGSRAVMRIAALAVPEATGAFTENGNRIGDITLSGSLGLIIFGGLLASLFFATIWVAISPWLPGTGVVKGLVAVPTAISFGAFGVIQARNPDFVVLGHDPLVVAVLLAFVGSTAPAMAVVDGWLDRRLPRPTQPGSRAEATYAVLTVIGAAFGGLLMLQAAASDVSRPMGLTIIAVGLVTIAWWRLRASGRTSPPRSFTWVARAILVAGTIAGFALLLPEIRGTLGLR